MCWSVFKIVAEASKRRQNTVLTTTTATAHASFYGKLRKDNKLPKWSTGNFKSVVRKISTHAHVSVCISIWICTHAFKFF